MKLSLKNLKVAEHLSEETTAFTATVYIDGKRAFYARNQGCGGENEFDPIKAGVDGLRAFRQTVDSAREFFIAQPSVPCEYDGSPLPMNLDFAISLEVEQALDLKDMRRCLKKVTVSTPEGIRTFKASFKPTQANLDLIARKYPGHLILNTLSEAEALKVWKKALAD
jgi:hypothetical protein